MFQAIATRRFSVGLIFVILMSGCCEPDYYYPKNELNESLTQHELTTFVDSAGNHVQLLFDEEGYDEYLDWDSDCERYFHIPYIKLFFQPASEDYVKYSQLDRRLYFPDFSVGVEPEDGTNTSIQGFEYSNCHTYSRSDSTGEVASVIIDKEYGLVMFSYRDEYRWERVLEW